MPSPEKILQLVDQFDSQLTSYRSPEYNEAQVRNEFIEPFFHLLGWDVYNQRGYAYNYKDVIYEDSIKVASATKAPDYAFRIGGTRKFFVEAKKPSVNLKDEISPAYQLRRYAWSAKLPLSILTDFEEFAVYDCRNKPNKTDKSSTGRILMLTYRDYSSHWDEISSVFSRDAVLKGSFDKYAEAATGKRGTAEVDDAFLAEIERWRDLLAHNIALRNPSLIQRDLNYAVQMTIDRLIFLRICEDRGIEFYGQLQSLLYGGDCYTRLCQLFRKADERYNSGLFHFHPERDQADTPDLLTPGLLLDDKPLKDIITNLYYPDSPYEFSVLPANILGQVYERFLGKVIRLTAGHHAVVEDKPEVKKAGGVFYTPTFIVEYIVKNTLGKLLEGKSPGQVGVGRGTPLRVLDMSCGSGSFLIGAYQYLLDWYLNGYSLEPEKWSKGAAPRLYQISSSDGAQWKLTTSERKRILLDHIYGVDIDPQAVEVTKLSLLLKVLEGESEESIGKQLSMFRLRALPDLAGNIKCGNSLIGPDFYTAKQSTFLNPEEQYRINSFDWQREFAHVLVSSGGFDVVVGNPPYLRIQGLQESHGGQIEYFTKLYKSAVKRFDLYLLFVEKGFTLLKNEGRLGFICPHKFLNSDFGSGLRKFLVENGALETFVSFGNNLIFEQATTYTGLLFIKKSFSKSFRYFESETVRIKEIPEVLGKLSDSSYTSYDLKDFSDGPWVLTKKSVPSILQTLLRQPLTLGDICDEILVGVQSGIDNVHLMKFEKNGLKDSVFLFSERGNKIVEIEAGLVRPIMRGEDVKRYEFPQNTYFCIYPYKLADGKTKIIEEKELKDRFPKGYAYLKKYQKELTEIRVRQKTNPKYWYSCHRSRDMNVFESERIITPEISLGCNMTFAPKGLYHNTKVYSIVPAKNNAEHQLYWLGLLNSKVLWWYLSNTGYVLRGGYFVFKTNYLSPFPVRTINFTDTTAKAQHDIMISLVEQILVLHKNLLLTKTPQEKERLKRQIAAIDHQIDALVYELYGLTDEEIRIVEGG